MIQRWIHAKECESFFRAKDKTRVPPTPTPLSGADQFQPFHESQKPREENPFPWRFLPALPPSPSQIKNASLPSKPLQIPQHSTMISSYLLLLVFSTIAAAQHQTLDPLVLPRPLILEYPPGDDQIFQNPTSNVGKEEVLWCTSWRFAGEANNLSPWKTVPADCGAYVKDYMTGKAYRFDLEMVADEAAAYARSVSLVGDGMDAWVFDVDETLLSNLPYYADHGYGLEVFNSHEFDKWVDQAMAPAIQSSLKLYEEILRLGFKIFLLTGRSEEQKIVTTENLKKVGFWDWEKLILRGVNDHGKPATTYKSEKRSEIAANGYRILGNSGDQWSDLLGSPMGNRSFKLPNPMYHIP